MDAFHDYRHQAEVYVVKMETEQRTIDQVEREWQRNRGPVAQVELSKHQPYLDLCKDRNRYQGLAQLYATLALLYK
jgi:hypothetical protein